MFWLLVEHSWSTRRCKIPFFFFLDTFSLRTLSASLGVSSIVLFLSLYMSLGYVHYGNDLEFSVLSSCFVNGVIVIELDKLSQRRKCKGRRLCGWNRWQSLQLSHRGLLRAERSTQCDDEYQVVFTKPHSLSRMCFCFVIICIWNFHDYRIYLPCPLFTIWVCNWVHPFHPTF